MGGDGFWAPRAGVIRCFGTQEDRRTEHIVALHIEKLPDGVYLATTDAIQGLVAQGCTIQETLEIARDVVKKLVELRAADADDFLNA